VYVCMYDGFKSNSKYVMLNIFTNIFSFIDVFPITKVVRGDQQDLTHSMHTTITSTMMVIICIMNCKLDVSLIINCIFYVDII
jgi:hypothetical protein